MGFGVAGIFVLAMVVVVAVGAVAGLLAPPGPRGHRTAGATFGAVALVTAILPHGNVLEVLVVLLLCSWGWIAGRSLRGWLARVRG